MDRDAMERSQGSPICGGATMGGVIRLIVGWLADGGAAMGGVIGFIVGLLAASIGVLEGLIGGAIIGAIPGVIGTLLRALSDRRRR